MSDKNDLSEEDLFGDLDLQPANHQPPSPPPVLTEISGQKPIIAPLPENTTAARFKPQTQAFIQPPSRDLTGLWIALAIILVIGGGGVGALYFLQLGPFATTREIKHTVFPVAPKTKRQSVALKSVPPGASISINGNPTPFKTPYTLRMVAGRKYKLVLKLKDFRDLTHEFTIKPGTRPAPINLTLQKATPGDASNAPKGVLFIECWPIGATIKIADKVRGKCANSAVRIELPGGTHPTEIAFAGYDPYTTPMIIPPEEVVTKKIILEKTIPGRRKPKTRGASKAKAVSKRPIKRRIRGFGQVSLACEPAAEVFWRGKKIGQTPFTYKLPAGRQRLVLKNKKIGALRGVSVYVKPRTVTAKKFAFRKGKIKFIIKPWADVYINGRKIGQTPIPPASLYEGYYTIELRMKKQRERKRIRVNGDETIPVFHAFPTP